MSSPARQEERAPRAATCVEGDCNDARVGPFLACIAKAGVPAGELVLSGVHSMYIIKESSAETHYNFMPLTRSVDVYTSDGILSWPMSGMPVEDPRRKLLSAILPCAKPFHAQ